MVHVSEAPREEISKNKAIILNSTPAKVILPPKVEGEFVMDDAVLERTLDSLKEKQCPPIATALLIRGTELETACHYGSSLWGPTAKLVTQLPHGTTRLDFSKVRLYQRRSAPPFLARHLLTICRTH